MTARHASDFLTPGHTIGAAYAPAERLGWPQRSVAVGLLAVATFAVGFGLYGAAVWVGALVLGGRI